MRVYRVLTLARDGDDFFWGEILLLLWLRRWNALGNKPLVLAYQVPQTFRLHFLNYVDERP